MCPCRQWTYLHCVIVYRYSSLVACVLTIENAWLCYRNRLKFKLLKHAVRAAVSETKSLMFGNVYITYMVFNKLHYL